MNKIYRIATVPKSEEETPIFCDAYTEEDAEEIGAALAKAGFDVGVWDFDRCIHEFFS